MEKEIEGLLRDLENVCSKVSVLRDMYLVGKDYIDDSRKISEFNSKFDQRKERMDTAVRSFVRFIENSFAPSEEEVARKKAEEKLRAELPDFDNWDENVKKSLIEREMRSFVVTEPQRREKRERNEIGTGTRAEQSIDNPEPLRVYAITDDFTCCKPSMVELRGERHAVSSWRKLLIAIGQQLFNNDENPLRLHIKNNPNRRMFTYDNNFHIPTEVANGIYTEGQLNTLDMMKRVFKLLDIYGVDYNEVKVYLSKVAAR